MQFILSLTTSYDLAFLLMMFLLFLHEYDAQNVLLTIGLIRQLFNSVLMGLARPDSYSNHWCFVPYATLLNVIKSKENPLFYMNMTFISSRDEILSIFTLHENEMK